MKKKNRTHYLEIKLDKPCNASWTNMRPEAGGRHCVQCEKTVHDFTEATDAELTGFFRSRPQNVCGRFRLEQLNRLLLFEPPTRTPQIGPWRSAALISGLLLGGGVAIGQSAGAPPPPPPPPPVSWMVGEAIVIGSRKISGYVQDTDGNPIIGAHVEMVGIVNYGVTDFDGYFILSVPDTLSDVAINISFIGYQTQTLTFDEVQLRHDALVDVTLKEKIYELPEAVVVGKKESLVECTTLLGGIGSTILHLEPPTPEAIEDRAVDQDLRTFPNPFRGNPTIHFKAPKNGKYQIALFDLTGRMLKSDEQDLNLGDQEFTLSFTVHDLPAATYLLRLVGRDGQTWMQQVVKAE